jgi:hypothetical protein
MECANCNCILGREGCEFRFNKKVYICCSKSCRIAKKKEFVQIECNSHINGYKNDIVEIRKDMQDLESKLNIFESEMNDDEQKIYDEIQQFDKQKIKMFQFLIIILVSLRDRKGTYPVLKLKYSEFMDEFMSQQSTSKNLCEIADVMKSTYIVFEKYYEILT